MSMSKINLGYCCVSTLHKRLKVSRCSTKTYLDSHDASMCHDYLIDKARKNLQDLILLLYENKKNEIYAYRVPEQILPQIDLGYYRVDELEKEIKETGKVANSLQMQLSTHPSQFFVLNSFRESVVDKTIQCLDLFADIFTRMELDKVPNMTLHVGVKNGYPSTVEACNAFVNNFKRLSEAAQKMLVLENDHVSFTPLDCLFIHEQTGIPVVFDNKHYEWNPGEIAFDDAVNRAVHTWGDRIPKLHLSSDKEGNKHAYSDFIKVEDYKKLEHALLQSGLPEYNVMLECKEKDLAILELRKELAQVK